MLIYLYISYILTIKLVTEIDQNALYQAFCKKLNSN